MTVVWTFAENTAHERFMQLQSQLLLGRDEEVDLLLSFINGRDVHLPTLACSF